MVDSPFSQRLRGHKLNPELPAPDFATVWAQVPEPILPAEFAGLGRLYRAAWELLCRLWRPMPLESGLPNGYVRTAERGNIVFLLRSGRVAYKTIEEA